MVKHVVPHMIARGYGKIVNIGSGTAYRGSRGCCTTSKGGILAFTRALSRELEARHPRQHARRGSF